MCFKRIQPTLSFMTLQVMHFFKYTKSRTSENISIKLELSMNLSSIRGEMNFEAELSWAQLSCSMF